MANDDYEVLTLKEVGQILRVHPVTLHKLIRKGKIPGFKNRGPVAISNGLVGELDGRTDAEKCPRATSTQEAQGAALAGRILTPPRYPES